jgi:hypothetical protein
LQAAAILRNQKGLNNKNIGLTNEKGLNQLLAHHAVIFKPKDKLPKSSTRVKRPCPACPLRTKTRAWAT